MTKGQVRTIAHWIRAALMSDSNIRLDQAQLALLSEAVALDGELLSMEECDTLVMGDESGAVPPELARRVPKTDHFIKELF